MSCPISLRPLLEFHSPCGLVRAGRAPEDALRRLPRDGCASLQPLLSPPPFGRSLCDTPPADAGAVSVPLFQLIEGNAPMQIVRKVRDARVTRTAQGATSAAGARWRPPLPSTSRPAIAATAPRRHALTVHFPACPVHRRLLSSLSRSRPQLAFQAQNVTPVEENEDFTEQLKARKCPPPSNSGATTHSGCGARGDVVWSACEPCL